MTNDKNLQQHLYCAKILVYDKCGFDFDGLIAEDESQEYGACTFRLNKLKIKFRISKITPTKTGQFVAIWKRNQEGVTQPFDLTDEIDFIIISSQNGDNFGQFIFPKSVLLDKGILTGNGKKGKRGIRVYPPWDTVANKQAKKTQDWQIKYFLTIDNGYKTNLNLAEQLFETIDETN
ncbi:MepB family protein [Chitinophaga sp. Ak27]|uniref:MepB family protein n=1 Tax=Chitinophaga sp. Ak27 TaxID=2726116 RepID=UPI001B7D08B1|nr:MepB family protein [Chitinophaga sp. Ak27]